MNTRQLQLPADTTTNSKWTDKAVYAAGAVVWRLVEGKLRILLIHRTKYRDITLPKGKVDPGEMLAETAVRRCTRRPASGSRSECRWA